MIGRKCHNASISLYYKRRPSLSNNLSENSIRPVTVGQKNWLFSDSPDGATANAMYLTIVEMAKAYDLNLYEYLKFWC